MGRLQNNPSIGWVHPKSTHVHPLAWGNEKEKPTWWLWPVWSWMTNLHVGTYVIHASMHLQLYISENSPFDSSKAVKKTSFISGWLLQKANKGISSYKLSASQDPKLHAESHSHFGRKDVMLQWLFASWKIGFVDWTWSLVRPNQNGEKDSHFHVDEEQITKWVAREPPASHLQIRRPLIYKVRKRKWQNYNLKTLESMWVQMCPVTAKQSSSLEDTCLLALDQSAVCHCSCVPWIKLQDLSQYVLLHFSRPLLLEALWQHPHTGSFLPLQLYQFTSYWE